MVRMKEKWKNYAQSLVYLVVGDDTVVDDDNLIVEIWTLGMWVHLAGCAVRRPPSVRNA